MDDRQPGDGLTIKQLLHALQERFVYIAQRRTPDLTIDEARDYERGVKDVLVHARYLVNSFHVILRAPPEILSEICSHFTTEEDVFSASQVCRYWRSALISSPSLWTRLPCRRVQRTITSLERCRSMPIRLSLDPRTSIVALENALLHGSKIASLAIHHDVNRTNPLHKLPPLKIPPVERLHLYSCGPRGQEDEEWTGGILQDLSPLRELFVRQLPDPFGKFTAPNLIHLALENGEMGRGVTIRSILDMLRGCPLLETILIVYSHDLVGKTALQYSPVSLPNLRSIELGGYEVLCGLITSLRFPPTVAAGFRALGGYNVCSDVPQAVMDSSRHVLEGMDIQTVILAVAFRGGGCLWALVRFEGVDGSLEITLQSWSIEQERIFCGTGVLFSLTPRLSNVKELQLTGCCVDDVSHLVTAMPNLTSICLFDCGWYEGDGVFGLICPSDCHLSPPFPHLERLTVLEPGPGLISVVQRRKESGAPLKTIVIGPNPRLYTSEQIRELRELVDDLRVEIPPDISEWSIGNRILNRWSETGIPGPDTLTSVHKAFKHCRLKIREKFRG